ncbi:MAG TPA: kelch repeat-containing protein [Myxococcota bacterium]|jgi:hypothetical protein|nr:kelch repeat-containing protein [Myxococcota bacterium]
MSRLARSHGRAAVARAALAVGALAVAAAGLAAAGCTREVGTLSIALLRPLWVSQDPFTAQGGVADLASLRVRVEADDLGVVEQSFPYDPGGASHLGAIAVGDGRVITVEGLNASDNVLFRGRSLPVTIRAGHNAISLYVSHLGFSLASTPMAAPRFGHTATVLADGRVLLAGGAATVVQLPGDPAPALVDEAAGAEIFHPTSAASVATVRATPRAFHAAVRLGARVLLSGGLGVDGLAPPAELFDPTTGMGLAPDAGLPMPRAHHAAAPLAGGGALVAGGTSSTGAVLSAAEVISEDQACGFACSTDAPMAAPRSGLQLTPLPDGTLLVTGGLQDEAGTLAPGAELYDPATRSFRSVGEPLYPRAFHTATALDDGRVVLIGGLFAGAGAGPGGLEPCPYIEVYDPATESFAVPESIDAVLRVARWRHTATLLPDGTILVVGGWSTDPGLPLPEAVPRAERVRPRFDFATSEDANMTVPRAGHTATLLGNGMVLIAGGAAQIDSEVTDVAEIYNP